LQEVSYYKYIRKRVNLKYTIFLQSDTSTNIYCCFSQHTSSNDPFHVQLLSLLHIIIIHRKIYYSKTNIIPKTAYCVYIFTALIDFVHRATIYEYQSRACIRVSERSWYTCASASSDSSLPVSLNTVLLSRALLVHHNLP